MKAINEREITKSYQNFGICFVILLTTATICVYLFLLTSGYEYRLLEKQVKSTDELLSRRKDIMMQFDMILIRFKQLSMATTVSSEEMNDQSVMLDNIQNSNYAIRELIRKQETKPGSFQLYQKMTDDVGQMAAIQDSLFSTKFQLESIRGQLESCLRTNRSAADKVRGGKFIR